MVRTLTVSAIVVLLLGSVASAQIGNIGPQTQAWNLGLNSGLSLNSGQGSADNTSTLVMVDAQYGNTSEGTTALQAFGGLLIQNSSASNVGAPMGVNQGSAINGDQLVTPAGTIALGQIQSFSAYGGPSSQYEGVAVTADQELTKEANGTGEAEAQNGTAMGMIQYGGTTCTTLGQGSLILGGQNSSLEGTTCASAGSVTTDFTAVVVQRQYANVDVVVAP